MNYLEKAKNDSEENLLWLCSVTELELPEKYALLEYYGEADKIFVLGKKEQLSDRFSARVRSIVKRSCDDYSYERVKEALWKKDARFISCNHKEYPEKFRSLDMPPMGFFCIGKMPDEKAPALAVVGARACSDYGLSICNTFSGELAHGGVQIISGMALGIDGASHKACIEAGGATFAVLGNGIGDIYPRENREIYYNILKMGGVISEYYIGCKGLRTHFPERNRLIAGLSDGVLVVEARKKSGTMITVNRSLEQGKDVFVIPGRIGDPLSEGCLELIKKGAMLVTNVNDIAFSFKDKYPDFITYMKDEDSQYCFGQSVKNEKPVLNEDEKKVYALISGSPVYFDELVMKSGIDYFAVFAIVEGLKEKNLVKEMAGGRLYR